MDFDVVIIGSGPAGGMAAIQCAEAGLKTALFEKVNLPRRKVCAGGVVKRAIKLLPKDLEYPIESICDTVELRLHDPEKSFQEHRKDLVTMVNRVDFDYAIIKHAEKKGAQILDGVEVKSVIPCEEHVDIITANKRYSAAYLIIAEGANSRIANNFWDDDRVLAPALESEIMLPPEKLSEFQGVARFDFDIITSGYAWVFPKKDHISVGICSFSSKKPNLNKLFDDYKLKIGLTGQHEERNRQGFIIPVKPRQQTYMKQRMILVGDAAGFADPITAEGFTYAFKSGIEAGQAIVKGANPEEVHQLYHKGINEAIVQELNIVSKLSKPFYFSQRMRKTLFKRYGARLCRGMADLIEGKQSYHKALAKRAFIARLIINTK
ncbi:geranylgeranyl reductase family [Mariprofundus aestuarium]|uniref:Geranylgeranyl reductase family n=1 Tax=Mariprofundus aestuarium TaxID=1921086 RepID=A0A2K8KXL8_MARES|nr:geranylgeranyl reductase family protein [Mariprofundus aestuarium]ATX79678.1 geranylgeranyl reductase family [Mariprofundus aestuarium]